MIFLALQQEFLVLRCDAVLARRFWMYSARKQLGNPLWIAKLFEYAVRQNRPSKTDVFLRQCAFALNSVYTRSGQNSTPNSNATNLHCCQKRCCSFGISSSNASPAFQVQKSIFHQMTKPIQVTVILPLLLAISLSWNDDIHSSISGISNDLIGVIPTIGQ